MEHLEEAKEIFNERLTFEELRELKSKEVSALIQLGKDYYKYLSEIKHQNLANKFGYSEIKISIIMEITMLSLLDLISIQSEKQKYQLLNVYGGDCYLHLN